MTNNRSAQIAALHDQCASTARSLLIRGASAVLNSDHSTAKHRIARAMRMLRIANKCAHRLGYLAD